MDDAGQTLAIASEGGVLDANTDLSLCPEAARSFPGQPGMIIRDGQDRIHPKFQLSEVVQDDTNLAVICRDVSNRLTDTAEVRLDAETHVIVMQACVKSDRPLYLDWLAAPVSPAPQNADETIDFAGRWCGEFQINRTAWSAGMRDRENRTGRAPLGTLQLPGNRPFRP